MANPVPVIRTFKNAPVIETVLSIQFAPIPNFSLPHFGLYWKEIRNEFRDCQVKPPILHLVEEFGPGPVQRPPSFNLELSSERAIRYWFIEEKGNSFLQLQQDRLLYNWQKVNPDDKYPRYQEIRSKFFEEWRRFCAFLENEKLSQPEVDQCEVTYVNHIEYTAGTESCGELNKVVAYWSGRSSGSFLPEPEKVNINVRYLMPENRGRLYISLQPVIRTRDAMEVLQLNLTSRGAPASSKTEEIFDWLDLGREWIVQGFTDFTTETMHDLWGLE